jgi:hypothetical protein
LRALVFAAFAVIAFDLLARNSKAINAKNAKNFRRVRQENQTEPQPIFMLQEAENPAFSG